MTTRPPLAATGLWQAVMQAANHRCQCTGTCGDPHPRDGGRCDRVHGRRHSGGTVRLIAAPADPAALTHPPHRTAAITARELAAWCPACHDHTRRAVLKRAAEAAPVAAPDALF